MTAFSVDIATRGSLYVFHRASIEIWPSRILQHDCKEGTFIDSIIDDVQEKFMQNCYKEKQ